MYQLIDLVSSLQNSNNSQILHGKNLLTAYLVGLAECFNNPKLVLKTQWWGVKGVPDLSLINNGSLETLVLMSVNGLVIIPAG